MRHVSSDTGGQSESEDSEKDKDRVARANPARPAGQSETEDSEKRKEDAAAHRALNHPDGPGGQSEPEDKDKEKERDRVAQANLQRPGGQSESEDSEKEKDEAAAARRDPMRAGSPGGQSDQEISEAARRVAGEKEKKGVPGAGGSETTGEQETPADGAPDEDKPGKVKLVALNGDKPTPGGDDGGTGDESNPCADGCKPGEGTPGTPPGPSSANGGGSGGSSSGGGSGSGTVENADSETDGSETVVLASLQTEQSGQAGETPQNRGPPLPSPAAIRDRDRDCSDGNGCEPPPTPPVPSSTGSNPQSGSHPGQWQPGDPSPRDPDGDGRKPDKAPTGTVDPQLEEEVH
ncbi:MAG: hypothetical protein ACRDXB_13020, partial [Actinomycetes bacterium]